MTDILDKTNDKVDEVDVDTLEAGIGSTFGQKYTVNDWYRIGDCEQNRWFIQAGCSLNFGRKLGENYWVSIKSW